MDTSNQMANNTPPETFLETVGDFLKSINFVFLALIYPLAKYIDKYFEYKKSKDKEFIKSAAKEGVREEMISVNAKMDDLKEDIKNVMKIQEQDRKDTQKQLMDIIKEQRSDRR